MDGVGIAYHIQSGIKYSCTGTRGKAVFLALIQGIFGVCHANVGLFGLASASFCSLEVCPKTPSDFASLNGDSFPHISEQPQIASKKSFGMGFFGLRAWQPQSTSFARTDFFRHVFSVELVIF